MLLTCLVLAILLASSPAYAGPVIVPFLIAAGATALGTVTAAGVATLTVLGTIVSAGITLAVSIGLSLLANALFAPKAPRPSDISGMVRQNLPPRRRHYGDGNFGGSLLAIETERGNLHMVAAHGDGEWSEVLAWIVDDRDVTLDGSGNVISDPYISPNPVIRIEHRLGTADQTAYASLIARLPALWTTDHRAAGVVTSYLYARQVGERFFSKTFPNRIPTWSVIANTAKVFDPRDEEQAIGDRSTHLFSRNLPLQLADYLAHPDGLQIPAAYINLERLAAAADVADEEVTIKSGGTIPRYCGGLSYSFDDEPASIVGRFLKAMDGHLSLLPDGTVAIDAGEWTAPSIVIGDDHVLSYGLRDGAGPLREANEIIVSYTVANSRYVEGQAKPWRDEDAISESGERRTMSIDAFEIRHHNHARRIAKLAAFRAAPAFRGTIVTDLCGINAWGERWVRFQISELNIDHDFEIEGMVIDTDAAQVTFQVLTFDGAAAYAFDAATEEGDAPVDPENPGEEDLEAPENVLAAAGERTTGGTTVVVMTVTWSPPERDDLSTQAQIAVAESNGWLDMAVSEDSYRAEYAGIDTDEEYDVRVRFVGPGGSTSAWTVANGVTPTPDTGAPGDVSAVSAVGGVDQATIYWTTPASDNFLGVRIYESSTSDVGDGGLAGTRYGAPGTSYSVVRRDISVSTAYFWVQAVNTSGVGGTLVPTGPISIG